MANYKAPYICPVCGKHTFEFEGDWDDCPVCGWTNDGIEEAGGVNGLSAEEYRREEYGQSA